MHMHHYPRLAGHPDGRRMYATLRHRFHCASMAADLYRLVNDCESCVRETISLKRNAVRLKLFPAIVPSESVAIDIFAPLQETNQGIRSLLVISGRSSKFTKTVPLQSTSAFAVARAFCTHWLFIYVPPVTFIRDNRVNFASNFFQSVC